MLVLGALAALTVAFVPGGLAGLVAGAAGRLAPAPPPSPAMAGATVAAGFIAVGREPDPKAFDPYAADDPNADDPYAAGDPFADGPDGHGNGHGNGHGDGRDA